jgi:hypothetical protein
MTISKGVKAHSIAVIDEYLATAKICIDTRKANSGILGYPAALLLLRANDAIGRSLIPTGGKPARLEVLTYPPFNLELDKGRIKRRRRLYRNPLMHNAQLGKSAVMSPEAKGAPFEFTDSELTLMRVPRKGC